jgi:transcriptional regulator with XRE-family HTH domain
VKYIGERVRRYRLFRGLSVTQVAKRINATPRYVEMIEAGSRTPSLPTLERLAIALDVSMADLVSDETQLGRQPNTRCGQLAGK